MAHVAKRSVFVLSAIVLEGTKHSDGSIDTYERDFGVYDSVEAAEAAMKSVLAMETMCFFAFRLVERAVNGGFVGPFRMISRWETVRSYFADGRLNCMGECDEACAREFTGREVKTIRHHVGDFVWVWRHRRIVPMLIGGLPMTKAEYKSRKAKRKGDAFSGGDWSDDCYYAYGYGHEHDHPACWNVFPYSGAISRRNRTRLEKCRAWYEDGL